jgi:hypothetical protein
MKSIITFLLFSICCFAQKNFVINNNTLYWEKVVANDSFNLYNFDKNLKLEYKSEDSGILKEGRCNCKKSSFFMKNDFNADFRIDRKEGKLKIVIYNFKFENEVIVNANGAAIQPTHTTLEQMTLKKSGGEFLNSKINKLNLECLNNYLENILLNDNLKDW